MRCTTFTVVAGLVSAALGQSLAPSPTNSIGCVPHDDHWHCDGPAVTPAAAASVSAAAASVTSSAHDHDDDHSDAAGSGTLAPSPTASIGCEPHGDHWHCSGPRTAGVAAVSGSSSPSASAPLQQSINAAPQQSLGAAVLLAAAGLAFAL